MPLAKQLGIAVNALRCWGDSAFDLAKTVSFFFFFFAIVAVSRWPPAWRCWGAENTEWAPNDRGLSLLFTRSDEKATYGMAIRCPPANRRTRSHTLPRLGVNMRVLRLGLVSCVNSALASQVVRRREISVGIHATSLGGSLSRPSLEAIVREQMLYYGVASGLVKGFGCRHAALAESFSRVLKR